MQNNTNIPVRQELKEFGVDLPESGRVAGFNVPEDYFESLPGRIQEAAIRKRSAKHGIPFFQPVFRPVVVAAGLVLLVASAAFFLLFRQSHEPFAWSDYSYPMDMIVMHASLDPQFVYDMVLDSDLTADEIQYGLSYDYPGLDEDAIFDYLYSTTDDWHDWHDWVDVGSNGG